MNNAIKIYRSEQGLTLAQLSAVVGLSKSFLSEVENGKRQVSPKMSLKLEALTGIPRHELRPDIYPPPENDAVGKPAASKQP